MAITDVDFIKFRKLLLDSGIEPVEFAKWVLAQAAAPKQVVPWPEKPNAEALNLLQFGIAQTRADYPNQCDTLGNHRLALVREPGTLQQLLVSLAELEISVLVLWFDIAGERLRTFKAISERLGISPSRASKVRLAAIAKLRIGLEHIEMARIWEAQGAELMNRPILMLKIDQSTKNLFAKVQIHTVGDLMAYQNLYRITNYGVTRHKQVQAALQPLGLALKDLQ